jgi:excisionase family DNA binding protein
MTTTLLRAEDVAALLACSRKTVFRFASEGRLPCVRLAERMVRFDPVEIEAWIEEAKRDRA